MMAQGFGRIAICALYLCSFAVGRGVFAQPPEPGSTVPNVLRTPSSAAERAPSAKTPQKNEVLARLRALQSRHLQDIASLEDSIRKSVKESTSLSLKEDLSVANTKIARLGERLSEVDRKRNELLARREFVDQLILLIDSKWTGQNLQAFLEHSLLDMAVTDLTNPQGSGDTWKFITYLSIAIREVPEQREDVFAIIESFMNFASVLNPRTPAEFLSNRHYTNGSDSQSATSVSRESLGDFLEIRNQELGRSGPRPGTRTPVHSPNPKADIEIRTRAPAPPSEERGTESEPAPDATSGEAKPKPQPEPMYISPRFKAIN